MQTKLRPRRMTAAMVGMRSSSTAAGSWLQRRGFLHAAFSTARFGLITAVVIAAGVALATSVPNTKNAPIAHSVEVAKAVSGVVTTPFRVVASTAKKATAGSEIPEIPYEAPAPEPTPASAPAPTPVRKTTPTVAPAATPTPAPAADPTPAPAPSFEAPPAPATDATPAAAPAPSSAPAAPAPAATPDPAPAPMDLKPLFTPDPAANNSPASPDGTQDPGAPKTDPGGCKPPDCSVQSSPGTGKTK
jgi:hypothetical protein